MAKPIQHDIYCVLLRVDAGHTWITDAELKHADEVRTKLISTILRSDTEARTDWDSNVPQKSHQVLVDGASDSSVVAFIVSQD